jgi:hypothetical protein
MPKAMRPNLAKLPGLPEGLGKGAGIFGRVIDIVGEIL